MKTSQSLTPSFHQRASVSAVMPDKAERVLNRCQAHYEKQRDTWVAKRYNALLLKEGEQPALRPSWAQDDRKSHLYRAAASMVQQKQKLRLQKINAAARRMMGLDRSNGLER